MNFDEIIGLSFALLFVAALLLGTNGLTWIWELIVFHFLTPKDPPLKKGPNRRRPLFSVNEDTGELVVRHPGGIQDHNGQIRRHS